MLLAAFDRGFSDQTAMICFFETLSILKDF